MTWACFHRANCTAKLPTPPAAAWISTFWPGLRSAVSKSACQAVNPAVGMAAAWTSSKEARGGDGGGVVPLQRAGPPGNPCRGRHGVFRIAAAFFGDHAENWVAHLKFP